MSTTFKSVPLLASKVTRNARVTAWGISMSDASSNLNVEALYLGGMNLAGAISAGSWSCPSMNDSAVDSYRHRVFAIDTLHLTPAECVVMERINNGDRFIADQYVWAMQHQVESGANRTTDHQGNEADKDAARCEGLNNDCGVKDVSNPGRDNAGFGTKLLTTSHSSILTQGVTNV